MTVVERAYSAALTASRGALDRLQAYRAKAEATGVSNQPDIARPTRWRWRPWAADPPRWPSPNSS